MSINLGMGQSSEDDIIGLLKWSVLFCYFTDRAGDNLYYVSGECNYANDAFDCTVYNGETRTEEVIQFSRFLQSDYPSKIKISKEEFDLRRLKMCPFFNTSQ